MLFTKSYDHVNLVDSIDLLKDIHILYTQ